MLKNLDVISWEIISFLELTLVQNPEERFSVTDMLQHEFPEKACDKQEIISVMATCQAALKKIEKEMEEYLATISKA